MINTDKMMNVMGITKCYQPKDKSYTHYGVSLLRVRECQKLVGMGVWKQHWDISLNTKVGVLLKPLTGEASSSMSKYIKKYNIRPTSDLPTYTAEQLAGGVPSEPDEYIKDVTNGTVTYKRKDIGLGTPSIVAQEIGGTRYGNYILLGMVGICILVGGYWLLGHIRSP